MPRLVKPIAHAPLNDRNRVIEVSRRSFKHGLIAFPFALAGCVIEDAQPMPERVWHHS